VDTDDSQSLSKESNPPGVKHDLEYYGTLDQKIMGFSEHE